MAEQDETGRITELEKQVFLAEHVIGEYRQALADTQFALTQANAKLKYATQPTA
ncbi:MULTISPECIES: hypothetical protein [Actinomycetes]|uniref:hypothetical protein n=1 Tax=Actinomycetes TaxID=1760 RepID=UPI00343FDF83